MSAARKFPYKEGFLQAVRRRPTGSDAMGKRASEATKPAKRRATAFSTVEAILAERQTSTVSAAMRL